VTHDDMVIYSKIIALLVFMPFFIGTAIWAYWPSNKAKFQAIAQRHLLDD
jgi:cbb3-type cytochrome oxidase subunit 3